MIARKGIFCPVSDSRLNVLATPIHVFGRRSNSVASLMKWLACLDLFEMKRMYWSWRLLLVTANLFG
jgi:hypothetical protein